MRRRHKKQIYELLQTLKEAHHLARAYLKRKQESEVLAVFQQCQEAALQIGEFIESEGGKGHLVINYLEDYCEFLYQTVTLLGQDDLSGEIFYKLSDMVSQIETCLDKEFSIETLVVVFLPYKASMWDSMESIWRAAFQDPCCESYVIPIPYFDKNSDGSLGRMHYDAEQFPDYVPITDWETYNIENNRPDIIYIHNPYDDKNFITTVHPFYYARTLKLHTDLLVYVPYFVCMSDVAEHFCINDGTIWADRVILQSKKVRNTYICLFKAFIKKRGCKDQYGIPEKKFLALGSPKYDKVMDDLTNPIPIPEDWKPFILKPDGGRKKVILYNTSISALLEGGDGLLHKLDYVFDFFKKETGFVLLWRPHPLSQATFLSMRPQLYSGYLERIKRFKEEAIGIYDESPDPHPSISVSDAYYGDGGSMLSMYRLTGRPIMLQYLKLLEDVIDYQYISMEDICVVGDELWFSSANFNSLFRMNADGKKLKWMGFFPNEKVGYYRLYTAVARHGNHLFFAPGKAREIGIYDLDRQQFTKIPIEEKEGAFIKFSSIEVYKQWVYFIPYSYPAIVRYDTVDQRIDYFTGWIRDEVDLMDSKRDAYFEGLSCRAGNSFASVFKQRNEILIFNMETTRFRTYSVGNADKRYTGLCFDGQDYWMLPQQKGGVVRWNPKSKIEHIIGEFPDTFIDVERAFQSAVYYEGDVWLFPADGNQVLRINTQDEKVDCVNGLLSPNDVETTGHEIFWSNCLMGKIVNMKLYLYTGKSGFFVIYDLESRERTTERLCTPSDVSARVGDASLDLIASPVRGECGRQGLKKFVKIVMNQKDEEILIDNFSDIEELGHSGVEIHKRIKEALGG